LVFFQEKKQKLTPSRVSLRQKTDIFLIWLFDEISYNVALIPESAGRRPKGRGSFRGITRIFKGMKFNYLALVGVWGFFLTAGSLLADNPNDVIHTRTYIGVVGTSVSVSNTGEFSGTNYARTDDPAYEVFLLPSLQQNFGYGFIFGHREQAYAVELSYWSSNHIAVFGPATLNFPQNPSIGISQYQDSATYQSINVDFKRYFFTEQNLQPFLILGVGFPWITLNDDDMNAPPYGSPPGTPGSIGSVTLSGLAFDTGLGLEYYFDEHFALQISAIQRWASFDEFKGFTGQYNSISQYTPSSSDDGSGLMFSVGTSIGFE
jgi:hypothetical protein